MADKDKQKTIIEITQDLPEGATVVPWEMRQALKRRLAAVELVEQRMAEARRDIKLAIAAAQAAGDDVPSELLDRLGTALDVLQDNI